MKRRSPEESLQRAVADYLDTVLPQGYKWFHPPNGGGRSKAEAGALRAQGVKRGVPDVIIVGDGKLYAVELKVGKNTISTEQMEWLDHFRENGFEAGVAKSVDDVRAFLKGAGIEIREVEGAA